MADSEGTWVFGVVSGDDFAASSLGQHSPTAASDTWAAAGSSVQPVFQRACVRAFRQLAKICAGELPLVEGIMLGASKLLTPGNGAAELALADERVRRPVEFRVSYDGGGSTAERYVHLASGTGSSTTFVNDASTILGSEPMQVLHVTVVARGGAPGLSTLTLRDDEGTDLASVEVELTEGVNQIDFLTEAGAHSVDAGSVVGFTIEAADGQELMTVLVKAQEVAL
jgi:hypothetical protein